MRLGRYWILKPYEAFGNRAEDLYFALLKCRRDELRLIILKRKWDLFSRIRFRKANKALLNIKHPSIVDHSALEIVNYLMTIVLSILRIVGVGLRRCRSLLGFQPKNSWFAELSDKVLGQAGLWGEVPVPFDAKRITIDWGRELEGKLNVRYQPRGELERVFPDLRGKKFVCLHVRTGGFFKDYECSVSRNADIHNYIPALRELTGRGYIIVRLGDPSMPTFVMDGVLDYAHSSLRNDANDVRLIEHCEFYIGSLSGPIDTACLFEKRILTVNCLSLAHCTWYRTGALFIPKSAWRGKRQLTLKEQIDMHLFEVMGTGQTVEGVAYQENTADDILEAVREFLVSPGLNAEQVVFNEYLGRRMMEYFETVKVWDKVETDACQKTRWASRILAAKGSVSAGYLQRHWQ